MYTAVRNKNKTYFDLPYLKLFVVYSYREETSNFYKQTSYFHKFHPFLEISKTMYSLLL